MGSSLSRMLGILDLFDEDHPTRTAEEICAALGLTTSTGYRYIRTLCAAGLLGRLTGGSYLLGVRVVELEYVMRVSDPIAKLGAPILRQLAKVTGCDTLLSNIRGIHVINVLHVKGIENLEPTYLRGRQHPLFRGAVSKAILPFLPRSQLVKIYQANVAQVADAGLGTTWLEFWRELQAIKRRGFSESRGELDRALHGLGVPVISGAEVVGSISLVFSRKRSQTLNQEGLVRKMQAASRQLSQALESYRPDAAGKVSR